MAVGSEIEYDPEFGIAMLNDSDVSTDDIRQAILDQAPEVAVLRRWALGNQSSRHTIFDRDKYVRPDTIFDKFRLAQEAAETDDIVSNVIETTEQLAFKRIAIECEDEDEENIWFQIADDINLPERMREIWRELFAISQAYPAVLFERKTLKVKGKSQKGTKRKKEFKNILVPSGITLLDPLKVIPIGNFMFNKEQLAYIADIEEAERFDETLAGANSSDLIISQLITGKYEFSDDKRGWAELQKLGEITGRSDLRDRLFLLNPDRCWRITATRPQYKRFAHVRMESVFELLDLKHLLREMDRALLLGSTNAIILVKKGDKDRPAKQHEINQLTDYIKTTSRIPIIVSDHRIEIEIITPKNDKILATERYNGLDSRITSRLYQILSTGSYSSGTGADDSIKLLRVIASSMEARRDQIRDSIMTHVFKPAYLQNDAFATEPKMAFYPRRIALDFDNNIAVFIQTLRDRGDISRETILAELDILQEDEAYKRRREAEKFDKDFPPTNVPFDSPNKQGPGGSTDPAPTQKDGVTPKTGDPKTDGRTGGGTKNGGGKNPESTRPNPSKT